MSTNDTAPLPPLPEEGKPPYRVEADDDDNDDEESGASESSPSTAAASVNDCRTIEAPHSCYANTAECGGPITVPTPTDDQPDEAEQADVADETPTGPGDNAHSRRNCGPPTGKSLFVSGLHREADFLSVQRYFEPFGDVVSCRVLRDARTGASRGIGYVNFESAESAQAALAELQGKPGPHGSPFVLRVADSDATFTPSRVTRVFARFIPAHVTEQMVVDLYQPFGTIVQMNLYLDHVRDGRYAWIAANVEFATSQQAATAIAKTDRTFPFGGARHLVVTPAEICAPKRRRMVECAPTDLSAPKGSLEGERRSVPPPQLPPKQLSSGAPPLPPPAAPTASFTPSSFGATQVSTATMPPPPSFMPQQQQLYNSHPPPHAQQQQPMVMMLQPTTMAPPPPPPPLPPAAARYPPMPYVMPVHHHHHHQQQQQHVPQQGLPPPPQYYTAPMIAPTLVPVGQAGGVAYNPPTVALQPVQQPVQQVLLQQPDGSMVLANMTA